MASLNILIIGNSIAGPTLASFLLLSPLNPRITLLERAPCVRPEGQNIDIRAAGLPIIRKLGLEKKIRENLTGELGVQWVDSNNKVCAAIEASKFGEEDGPTADIEILRGTLARIMVERCEQLSEKSKREGRHGVDFIYGDYVEDLQQNGDHVQVQFAKSKEKKTYDLVVGADGLQSRTRRLTWGVEGESHRVKKPHRFGDLGLYGAFFSIPRSETDTGWRRWYHAPGRRGIMLRPSDRKDRTTVSMFVMSENDDRFSRIKSDGAKLAEQKAFVEECFSGAGWETDRVLKEMRTSNDFYCDMIAQVKMDKWSKGRVVLLGDAAYCASPLSGKGTTLALNGAYNLAGALVQHPDNIPVAFAEYEETMRSLTDTAQNLSPILVYIFSPDSQWAVWLANSLVGILAWSASIFKLFISFAGARAKAYEVKEYGFSVLDDKKI